MQKFIAKAIATASIALPLTIFSTAGLADTGPTGKYTLTFLSDPGGNPVATRCIVFTQTGADPGFPESGTVNDTAGILHGEYQIDGQSIRVEFVVGKKKHDAMSLIGTFGTTISGGYSEALTAYRATFVSLGNFTMAEGCS